MVAPTPQRIRDAAARQTPLGATSLLREPRAKEVCRRHFSASVSQERKLRHLVTALIASREESRSKTASVAESNAGLLRLQSARTVSLEARPDVIGGWCAQNPNGGKSCGSAQPQTCSVKPNTVCPLQLATQSQMSAARRPLIAYVRMTVILAQAATVAHAAHVCGRLKVALIPCSLPILARTT